MGISTHFYTIYGIETKGKYPKDFSKAYYDVYEDVDTPFVLFDGMNGEYMILGVKLFDSGDARWGFENGDIFAEIDLNTLSTLESGYEPAAPPVMVNEAVVVCPSVIVLGVKEAPVTLKAGTVTALTVSRLEPVG